MAPGAYDALSARLIEQAGFDVVYMTGFGTTASLIGRPDVGLLSAPEMVDNARRIGAAVDVPVIADADTGYGNAINVVRTVQAYEQAGVAGIQLEDQVMPKKCGHMSGKALIGADEMVGKLRAAAGRADRPRLRAHRPHRRRRRRGAGRGDRPGPRLRRGRRRRAVRRGADVRGRHRAGRRELAGVAPLVFNWAEGGRTPPLSLERIAELGFSLVIYPIGTLLAATAGIRSLLATLKADGTPVSALGTVPTFEEFTEPSACPRSRRSSSASTRPDRGGLRRPGARDGPPCVDAGSGTWPRCRR